jgi:hypothetical protein
METGLCIMTEACGTCLVDFRRTMCCIIIDAVAVQLNVCQPFPCTLLSTRIVNLLWSL